MALVKVLFLFAELAQRSQLCRENGKFRLGRGYVDAGFGVFQMLFSGFLGGIGTLFVQVFATNRGVRQDRDRVGLHFQNAAGNEQEFFFAIGLPLPKLLAVR